MLNEETRPRRVLVTGASGLIGHAVVASLERDGVEVLRLSRGGSGAGQARWDPAAGAIDAKALDGVDTAIHLAGEPVAEGRWTPEKKARILQSREQGTRLLSESLARLASPPRTLLSASAVGIYGDRGEEVLTEQSPAGSGFLADVCRRWEAATSAAADAGIRVVHLRFGVVLSREGGMLSKLLTPFLLGVGAVVGSGRQFVSWISLPDAVAAMRFLLENPGLSGAVNVVAPTPATNRELTITLGRILRRPSIFPLPAPVARLLFGEMADEALLASQRAVPRVLESSGFRFEHPDLETALRTLLGR